MAEDMLKRMESRFNVEMDKNRASKASNSMTMTEDKYNDTIDQVLRAKQSASKVPKDYWLLNRFDVLLVQTKNKLIFPLNESSGSILYYVHDSELFDVLHEVHISIGHGGRDRMLKELSTKYKNVARRDVEVFIQLCEPCQQKQKGPKKGIVVKPLIFSEFNSRCQVDLIDFQSQPDEINKFIMVYQDHLTKFVILNSLKTKTAEEVVAHLLDIFTLIGAPSVLQSDNGKEFANALVNNLKEQWPALKIVHGKPRHSQSQGSVERANQDIEKMLATWMTENKTNKWSSGLKFVQLMKNRAYHAGIKRSPYEALFGCPVKVGLSTYLPQDAIENISSEEELENIINAMQCTEMPLDGDASAEGDVDVPQDIASVIDSTPQHQQQESIAFSINTENIDMGLTCDNEGITFEGEDLEVLEITNEAEKQKDPQHEIQVECIVCSKENTGGDCCEKCSHRIHSSCAVNSDQRVLCILCDKKEKILLQRKEAHGNLLHQAKKMKLTSDKKFPAVDVGSTVRVPVPDVDRGKGDARNILAYVTEVTEDGFYRLGTRNGMLKQLYARSQISVCKQNLLDAGEVKTGAELSLRSVATKQSTGSGQGFFKCSCTTKCTTNKCKCKRNKVLCNSKCHSSLSCLNK